MRDAGRRGAWGLAAAALAAAIGGGLPAEAQLGTAGSEAWARDWSRASHVILPQASGFALDRSRQPIGVERVDARVEIVEQAARTTLDIGIFNPSGRQAEAVLLLPVPEGAAVSHFAFEGGAAEPTARLLPREEARRIYDEIVARIKDPALLEFAGLNLIRSSVFPVPAGGRQRLRLTYEHVLAADGNRVDYVLPRSESLALRAPWHVSLDVRSKAPISMIYSPSHELVWSRRGPGHLSAKVREDRVSDPGSFRFSYLVERDGVSASLLAYPDPQIGGGYFLLLAGLPAKIGDGGRRMQREVTLVLDRSGSMAGEKMDQARTAALQVIEGLEEGEAFNIIDYSSQVALFAAHPVIKSRETTLQARRYLDSIRPTGGTNIHDALLEALRQEPRPGMLPIVLFLTDGLPTVGRTSEIAIREMVEKGNPHRRRIFTFGVGGDVNVPLLDRLSDGTRATSTFVLPGEDVEVKVAGVFRRLYGPVLADLELSTLAGDQSLNTRAVRELMPAVLPDLFEGDQLVLLGQYRDAEGLDFRLRGNYLGQSRTFAFHFDLAKASTRNSFVPRLWATRKITFLIDQIRQAGAAVAGGPLYTGADLLTDPRYRELAEEILRLSTEFGVLSEYTAFLATEGTDLANWGDLQAEVNGNLERQAVRTRFGLGAVNQGRNFNERKQQVAANPTNGFFDAESRRVEISTVQQVADRAFFRRGNEWIDARLIAAQAELRPDVVVDFGSEEHRRLLSQLVRQGRQGLLSLRGNILIQIEGRQVLVQNGDF